ncbi:MAG: endonuclease/exonuclease/phosphatase family protein, partial [Candidatus Sericytochromatia bacterium]|nr:endonuclease/exonuclease/phosphatase family protein [Candidatus Sericytochromatia bacterium]
MKIATWNVNGIRAVTRNGFASWLAEEAPDVLCLQEVRALPDQV